MVSKKFIRYINELQEIQRLALETSHDVALHSLDSSRVIDARSYIGMYALDFTKPILVVCEDPEFHRKIQGIGENAD
ncbi:MAG: hypothetical protein LBK75_08875 [Oscillospiraceae bacterium]|jgi:hypothetical protein|nr:hypothetical protein [Oscillospiraceae bacterium]